MRSLWTLQVLHMLQPIIHQMHDRAEYEVPLNPTVRPHAAASCLLNVCWMSHRCPPLQTSGTCILRWLTQKTACCWGGEKQTCQCFNVHPGVLVGSIRQHQLAMHHQPLKQHSKAVRHHASSGDQRSGHDTPKAEPQRAGYACLHAHVRLLCRSTI